ncbi:Nramp family divalent metal transporter, partial [Candidatus Woesebacteria bacterium]|nr:Nramp family divalent metal transporter [Candidatus Woesebacteria bacterium]
GRGGRPRPRRRRAGPRRATARAAVGRLPRPPPGAGGGGLGGGGEGWWLFPETIALMSFLAAFAYAGGGGNLNFAQSYYIKEKGFGMGAYAPKIGSITSSSMDERPSLLGQTFPKTKQNKAMWQQWWQLVTTEHRLVFWGGGIVSIVMLSVLAHALVPEGVTTEGLAFLYSEAATLAVVSPLLGKVFLLSVATMLFSTQLIVLESTSRIISENILLIRSKTGNTWSQTKAFFTALWGQITLGVMIIISGFQEPHFLLTLAAALNAGAMMVAFILIFFLNKKQLEPEFQPGKLRSIGLGIATLFFIFFVCMTIWQGITG